MSPRRERCLSLAAGRCHKHICSEEDTNLLQVGSRLPRLSPHYVAKARPGFRWHCLRSKGFTRKKYKGQISSDIHTKRPPEDPVALLLTSGLGMDQEEGLLRQQMVPGLSANGWRLPGRHCLSSALLFLQKGKLALPSGERIFSNDSFIHCVCRCVYVRVHTCAAYVTAYGGERATCWLSSSTPWEPGLELRSSGLAASPFTH